MPRLPGTDAIMPLHRSTMSVMIASLSLLLFLCGMSAAAAERPVESGEHDFGDAIVVFTLEYEDDLLPAPPWALAEARIRRLGNVFFLTGIEPAGAPAADGAGPAPRPARRSWIPLADVVRLAEYDDVESALEALEIDGTDEEGGRPVVRRVSRNRQRDETRRNPK